jgi:hypothetical protein
MLLRRCTQLSVEEDQRMLRQPLVRAEYRLPYATSVEPDPRIRDAVLVPA